MDHGEKSKVIILNNKDDINLTLLNEDKLFLFRDSFISSEVLYRSSEKLAGIGICNIHLPEKKVNFSDNLYRILGYEPGSFIPTLRLILKFVHPEDKKILKGITKIESEVNNNSEFHRPLRIITKNEETKYVSINSKLKETENAQTVMISVKDITMEMKEIMKLREQNKELKRINAQLSAFNMVASHDLQEPLRKIQIFSSRMESINDATPHNISDYTFKIKNTAQRMQQLVSDLIAYSETSKPDIKFEKVNLKNIVKGVLKEMAFHIDEKKASITTSELPEATVIPFQIHQLFVNILSNSLKYCLPDVPPKVTIKQEDVTDIDLNKLTGYNKSDLISISIEDNGIGFDPIEAENIFLVFKRLHGKLEFDGTGIGLAICKNIIDNHTGYIRAEGNPGSGTKITFTLPRDRN
ncbi:hypothetical protein GCM10011506_18440 [Marivirga lumbricoides]|uniref:histidine kinase n=1 Tax=Marivirga lumbricoides TaxID=1046115 RepID=A0ABQ1M2P1_9BACT|nr:hypothetical protein GCM10011506_18440 [Marivirga lumbricoides]